MSQHAKDLITGMSATGKSSALLELARRGHRVVHTDDPGWSTQVATADGSFEQLWVEPRIEALLAEDVPEGLFVAGCVRNQGRFHDRFDAVILLSAPVEVMLDHVASRASNRFGRARHERQRILCDHAESSRSCEPAR